MAKTLLRANHERVLIALLTVFAAAMIGAAWLYYRLERNAVAHAAVNELTAVVETESAQVGNWRRERLADGRVLQASPLMATAGRALSAPRAEGNDRAELTLMLGRMAREFRYADISLVDADGSVHFRLMSDEVTSDSLKQHLRRKLAGDAIAAGDAILSDLTLDTRAGQPLMALAVPVEKRGAIILEIDPANFLYPYLRSWPTPRRTAETLLFRSEGADRALILNQPRDARGKPLLVRMPIAAPRADGPGPSEPLGHYTDYRGEAVMGVFGHVPDSPWDLFAKIDWSEVNASLARLWWELIVVAVLIALANAVGVGLVWRSHQLDSARDREARFRTIANDTPAYLWMSGEDGAAPFVNHPLRAFLGSEMELMGGGLAFAHPEDRERVAAAIRERSAARGEFAEEFRARRADGEYRWVIVHGVPRFAPRGEFLGYAGSMIDITERRDAEDNLQAANSVLALGLKERTRAEGEIRALTARLIEAQEEERTRLARELHDDLSQQIAAVSIGASNLKRRLTAESGSAIEQCAKIQEKLSQLAGFVRQVSHQLHPAVLEHSGLGAALRSYCKEVESLTSRRIAIGFDGSFAAVRPAVALCVYRVAQEAIQNSIKHARAEGAEVTLRCDDSAVYLTVSDRGIGLDPAAPRGLGLVSMEERARLVHGTVEVKNRPGGGVSVELRAPLWGDEGNEKSSQAALGGG